MRGDPDLDNRLGELVAAWQRRAYDLEMTPDSNETPAESACRLARLAAFETDIMELRAVLDGEQPNVRVALDDTRVETHAERADAVHRKHCDALMGCKFGDDDRCPVVAEHEAAEAVIDAMPRADAMRRRLDAAMLDLDEMHSLQTTAHGGRMINYARQVLSHVISLDDYHVLASTQRKARR